MTGRTVGSLMLFLLFSWLLVAADIEFRASVNANKIGMDDVLILTLTFKGIDNPDQPDLNDMLYFKVLQTSRSSEFQFVNGLSTYYTNFEYYLSPTKLGTLIVPSIPYKFEGKEYKTEPISIEVVKGSVSLQQNQPRRRSIFGFEDDDAFSSPFRRQRQPQEVDIRLVPQASPLRVYKGQPVIFKVMLYTRTPVESFNLLSNQSFSGFWQEWYPMPKSIDSQEATLDGKTYRVFEIRKAVLFPNQTGTLTIPPLQFEIYMAGTAFSFFGGPKKITRATPELKIESQPLPTGETNFPVGNFTFSVELKKQMADVNDILTAYLTIQGEGNIKTIEPPIYSDNEYIKVYPPKITRDYDFSRENLSGVMKVEIPLAFKKTGTVSLPALDFQFFQPRAGKIIALQSPAFSLEVTGNKENREEVVSMPRTDIVKTGDDIGFIQRGRIYDQLDVIYRQNWYVLLLVASFLINLMLLAKRYFYDRWFSQSDMMKKHRVLSRTMSRLKNVKMYGDIAPVLEQYIHEKSGKGFSEINAIMIEGFLRDKGLSEKDLQALIRIKTAADSSKFSGVSKSAEQLKQDVLDLEDLIKKIDGKIT